MKESIIKLQSALGVTADGIIGVKTLTALAKKVGACVSSVEKTTIKNIQTVLGVTADGIIGSKTLAAALDAIGVKDEVDPLIEKYLNKPVTFTEVKYKQNLLKQSTIRSGNSVFGKAGNESYLVSVKVPENYPLKYAGQRVKTIRIHNLVSDRLEAALNDIINFYGEDIEKVAPGACVYDGSYNYRKTASGSSQSIHSWGLALDFDAGNNALKTKAPNARLSQPIYKPFLDILEHHGFASLGRHEDYDWMHVQATLWG